MKIIVSLFLFLFFCLPVFSQSSVWVIEKNNSKIYLGGSVHVLRDADYPLPKEFDIAFNDSEILVLETNLDDTSKQKMGKELIGLTLYPNNKTLQTELSKDVYEELSAFCKARNIPLERFHGYKPIMIILTLLRVTLHEIGASSTGVDKYYNNKAVELEKTVLGLESYDEQLHLMAGMGRENYNSFVRYSLKDFNDTGEKFEALISDWRSGESSMMIEQINDYKLYFPVLYNSLMVERNKKWIPQIESYFNSKETEFVLFGAMHLYGEDGVLQLLENKGYTIRQL
jgi:uncharacterized protein YbaP (TraB family)